MGRMLRQEFKATWIYAISNGPVCLWQVDQLGSKQSQQRILFHPGIGAFRRPYCDIKFKGKNVIRERIPAVPIRRYRPRNAKIFLWSGNRYLRQQNITWNELLLEQSHEEIWN